MPEEELGTKLAEAAQAKPRRGRPRKDQGDNEPAESAETGVDESENNGADLDEAEVAEILKELGPEDKLPAPIEDYRALAGVLGQSVKSLIKKGIDPYKCAITVERRGPSAYRGQRVKTGVLRQYSCGWPFNIDKIVSRIEEEQGGTDYVFVIRHEGRALRSLDVTIDEPPKTLVEQLYPEGTEPSNGGADELDRERNREEKLAKLLEARKVRLQRQRALEEENPPEPKGGDEVNMLPEPEPPDTLTREQAEQLWREREERAELKRRLDESQRQFEALRQELMSSKTADAGSSAVIQAMQQSTAAMMKGLEMVVSNVGQQLSTAQTSNREQIANMLKMMELNSQNQRELTKTQMDSRDKQTELLLNLATSKQELAAMNADKQMDLMKQGMEFAREMQAPPPPGGEDELDWAKKAGNMLVGLIGSQIAQSQMSGQAPGGKPQALPPPPAVTEDQIRDAAKKAADAAIARLREQRGHGTQVPPAVDARGQAIQRAWPLLMAEVVSKPQASQFVTAVLAGPRDLASDVGRAGSMQDLLGIVQPYVPGAQTHELISKLMADESAQVWIYEQIMKIKNSAGPQAPPAAAPVPPPAPQVAPPAPAPAAPVAAAAPAAQG